MIYIRRNIRRNNEIYIRVYKLRDILQYFDIQKYTSLLLRSQLQTKWRGKEIFVLVNFNQYTALFTFIYYNIYSFVNIIRLQKYVHSALRKVIFVSSCGNNSTLTNALYVRTYTRTYVYVWVIPLEFVREHIDER